MPTATIKISAKKKKQGALLGAGIIFFIIGWIMVIQPALDKIQGLEGMRANAKLKEDFIHDISGLKKQQKSLSGLLFNTSDRHTILGKLTELTHQSGLEVVAMEPSEKVDDAFIRIGVNFQVSANFKSLVLFLSKLEEMKPSLAVTHLRMEKNTRDSGGVSKNKKFPLQVVLTLEGLMRKE